MCLHCTSHEQMSVRKCLRDCEFLADDDDENCDRVTLIIRRAGEHEEARENARAGRRAAADAEVVPAQGDGQPWPAGCTHGLDNDLHHDLDSD